MQALLALLAAAFLLILVAIFTWGISDVVKWVNGAVGSGGTVQNNIGFDLKTAGQLNLRGLVKPQQ